MRKICPEHGHQHEADHAASAVQPAQHRQPLPQLAALAERKMPHAGACRRDDRDADQRHPPRHRQRRDQRERRQRRERRLHGEDRELRGDQGRHLRADLGRGAAQRRDPRRDAQLAVEHAAEHLHARRPIQHSPVDGPARGLDRQMPCLGARQQRDDLQHHRDREHRCGDGRQRGGEFMATSGEQEPEHRRRRQRPGDRDQDTMAAAEVTPTALPRTQGRYRGSR